MVLLTKAQAYRLFDGGQEELQERFRGVVGHGQDCVAIVSLDALEMVLLRHQREGRFSLEGEGAFYEELCKRAGVEPAESSRRLCAYR